MQQAILITAYTNLHHLDKIINFLGSNFNFYIHIDKKSKITDNVIARLSKKKNVFISCKYDVNWGGINHLKCILLLLNEAHKNPLNNFFHLITGHDYPIKSEKEIESFLLNNSNKSFMEYNKFPYDEWEEGGYDRMLYYNLYDCFNARSGWKKSIVRNFIKIQKACGLKRSFPKNFPNDIYGGSTYWSLHKKCVDYVFEYLQANPSFLKRFKYTFCSEEIFFQTILLNSPFKESIENNNKRFIVWEERNGNYPANLDERDFDSIIESEALFARKFDYPVSLKLLESIDQHMKTRRKE